MSPLQRRTVSALAAAMAAASLGFAGTASAADPPSLCPDPNPGPVAIDGSYSFGNQAGSAGCVMFHNSPTAGVSLESVIVAPGWSYEIDKNEASSDRTRIEVRFTNARDRVELRYESGRLEVK